jgi:hypothetical protein
MSLWVVRYTESRPALNSTWHCEFAAKSACCPPQHTGSNPSWTSHTERNCPWGIYITRWVVVLFNYPSSKPNLLEKPPRQQSFCTATKTPSSASAGVDRLSIKIAGMLHSWNSNLSWANISVLVSVERHIVTCSVLETPFGLLLRLFTTSLVATTITFYNVL